MMTMTDKQIRHRLRGDDLWFLAVLAMLIAYVTLPIWL